MTANRVSMKRALIVAAMALGGVGTPGRAALGLAPAPGPDDPIVVAVRPGTMSVAWGHLVEWDTYDLVLILRPEHGWSIVGNSTLHEPSGEHIWEGPAVDPQSMHPTDHLWRAAGVTSDGGHAAIFHANLARPGTGPGPAPELWVRVNDMDVDVDSDNDNPSEYRAPSHSQDEDDLEFIHPFHNDAGMRMFVGDDWATITIRANVRRDYSTFKLKVQGYQHWEFSKDEAPYPQEKQLESSAAEMFTDTNVSKGVYQKTFFIRPARGTNAPTLGDAVILTGMIGSHYSPYDPENPIVADAEDKVLVACAGQFELDAWADGTGIAATDNTGAPGSPNVLLAGFVTQWTQGVLGSQSGKVARVELSARQSVGIDYTIEWTWTSASPDPGNSGFVALTAPPGTTTRSESFVGPEARFIVEGEGRYVFTAQLKRNGQVEAGKEIEVYAVTPHVTRWPKYIFANAPGCVPFEFTLKGADAKRFLIDTNAPRTWNLWDLRDGSLVRLELFSGNLAAYAVSWQESEETVASEYVGVSGLSPLLGVEVVGSGMLQCVNLTMDFTATLDLGEGQYTTVAELSGLRNPVVDTEAEDSDIVRFLDSRWDVIRINDPLPKTYSFVEVPGEGRFDHLASDDNDLECPGIGYRTGTPGTFTAGYDERYSGETERHYHTAVPRGFEEAGDIAIAGVQTPFGPNGVVYKAELYDDNDYPWGSEDEEEYVAKYINGGFDHCVHVSYDLTTSPQFGPTYTYYDLGEGPNSLGTHGSVKRLALANSTWYWQLDAPGFREPPTGALLRDGSGLALGSVGTLVFSSGPPAWIIGGAGILISSTSVACDLLAFGDYDRREASALLTLACGTVKWDEVDLAKQSPSATGFGYGVLAGPYGSTGIYADTNGETVYVGNSVRTGFEVSCTAQNKSFEWDATPVVSAKVGLQGTSGLDTIRYSWGTGP